MHFERQTMLEIIDRLKEKLEFCEKVHFEVINPDICHSCYAGEIVASDNKKYIYRGYKAWSDLAEILSCKMLTPEVVSKNIIRLHFLKLDTQATFHTGTVQNKDEKYGTDSHFFNIHKNEEPVFIQAYSQSLKNVNIKQRKRVLNLGINRGDEFEVIKELLSDEEFRHVELVGIDHSKTAIDYAQERFEDKTFYRHDINAIDTLNLGRFDLIISIGTLQTPGINFKLFFNALIQNYLSPGGAVILGFPNSRWMGGEMVYGAKMPNYSDSDLSLLFKDVYYCKKYLQQKKFRLRLTGRDYIFLTATKTG
ncbi:class I SAM-dependent methyltransferase [bacterium]|nr:class I SAM-dependent methyltransferase [bacterium]MBU1993143.1 class I SAM-dependent methyltransferase [bacterium]